MEIKAIIIEDETPARELLQHYIKSFPEITICGTYADGYSGLKGINEIKPQLVYLDIQMPKLTGIEILDLLDYKPAIIFTTAYDQFAVKAFEANAVDYLLKPFSQQRFSNATLKAIERITLNLNNHSGVTSAIQSIEEKIEKIERIAVRAGSKIQVIPISNILYFESDGDYVKIHAQEGTFLKEKTMKYFESHLDDSRFVRIHRSYLVNVEMIQKVEYYDKESHVVVLKNGVTLKVSGSGYKLLKKVINL